MPLSHTYLRYLHLNHPQNLNHHRFSKRIEQLDNLSDLVEIIMIMVMPSEKKITLKQYYIEDN